MEYKAIILDMDGLMFDTERLSDEMWLSISEREKFPILPADLGLLRGKSKKAGKADFFKKFGEDFPYDKVCDEVEAKISAIMKTQVPIKAGLIDFLEAAKSKGVPIAVASSTHRKMVEQNLKIADVAKYISVIATGDEVENSKPAPDIFLLAAQRLGVEAHECIAFEDSPNGVRSATAAGCSTVMIPDREQPTPELKRLSAYVVENLDEAIALL